MDEKLHGKTVLITGASEGVGRAIAETLSKQQMNLALISRSRDKLEQVAENVTKAGSQALVLNTDTELTIEGPAKSILSPAQALPPVVVIPFEKLSLSYTKSSVPDAFISFHESVASPSPASAVNPMGAG